MACMDVISKAGQFMPQGNRFRLALPLNALPSNADD